MKKLVYAAAAVLLLGAASCGHSDDSGVSNKFFSQEASDSLLLAFGNAAGAEQNASIAQQMAVDSTFSKGMFMKGLQYGLASDTSNAYVNGVIIGLQIQKQLAYFRSMGVTVNPRVAIDAFKSAVMDSVADPMKVYALGADYRKWVDSLTSAKHNYDLNKLASSPEAIENLQKGASYLKAKKAENDSIKIAESGLGYKIVKAGAAEKIDVTKPVKIKFTAKTISGKEVGRALGQPVNLSRLPKGLQEGVAMLGNGGQAVFYAPGNLAFGLDVPQGIDAGLNEMVVYEVTDVEQVQRPDLSNAPRR